MSSNALRAEAVHQTIRAAEVPFREVLHDLDDDDSSVGVSLTGTIIVLTERERARVKKKPFPFGFCAPDAPELGEAT